jgi:hypothetical protein
MSKSKATPHLVYAPVEIRDALALLKAEGKPMPSRDELQEKYNWLFRLREEKIHRETKNPLLYGYRPPVWFICMAVLGLDWLIPPSLFKADGTKIEGGGAFGAAVRSAFGMKTPWDVLCVLGGNRSAKSELECYLAMASVMKFERVNLLMFHTDSEMSRKIHQQRMYTYLPPELKQQSLRGAEAYISYKAKTGFSDGTGFILPNGSECGFRNYQQQRDKIEGEELGEPGKERCIGAVADELIPADWLQTLFLRLATRSSAMMLGFTPIYGYSPTVGMFMDGSKVLRYGKAFLVPRDGGAPAPELALTQEDCLEWIGQAQGRPVQVESWKSIPADQVDRRRLTVEHPVEDASTGQMKKRLFRAVPRVIQSQNERMGVICFHSDDNPFGNAPQVWNKVMHASEDELIERYYGFTERRMAGAFPLFDEEVHGIAPEAIPEEGTNYMICDPSKDRNMFMLWLRVTPEEIYIYREWPCPSYAIPTEGFTGPWAEPSDKAKLYDGKKGPAQKNFGWGLIQYKKEIARLEQWDVYNPDASAEEVKTWDEYGKAGEKIYMRFLDARFGNANGYDEGGQINLFEQFDAIGLTFYESVSGSRHSIDDGVQMINDALAYDTSKPVDYLNRPRLRISTACRNLIFAMKIWTGLDGQKGACKDPVDCLRMGLLKDVQHVDVQQIVRNQGGGVY